MGDVKVKKEIIIKRVSAFKFEIQVSNEPTDLKPQVSIKTPNQLNFETSIPMIKEPTRQEMQIPAQRISVIQRAPPASAKILPEPEKRPKKIFENTVEPKSSIRTVEAPLIPAGAVLIKDAIMYRMVEIFLWKLLGEKRLQTCGYPTAPTYRVLWKVIYYSCFEPGARKPAAVPLAEDHDCRGNIVCFMDHVSRLLEICAPTRDLWKKFGWTRLSVADILKKNYYEDLVPYLNQMELNCDENILHSHADILLLEKWEEQGFTAISWNGQKHFSQIKSESDRCPRCSNGPPRLRENTLWHMPIRNKQDGRSDPGNCKGHAQNYLCTKCVFEQKAKDERMASKEEATVSKESRSNGYYTSVQENNRTIKKRGRPSFKNKNRPSVKKSKRVLLWKFIYDLVEDPETDDYIRWVDRKEGVFQIINSEWLARTWGRNHGNPKMTYEKMARAMRTYYRSKVLQSVPRSYDYPRKLIYRFNPRVIDNSQNKSAVTIGHVPV